ncbi:circularly permuted ATPgrasp domain protein, partial [Leptospira wolffii]|uniref:circularly permuted ATPgrasp domain protein n=1 Tax=Leptospira wolffii TaxID=409998 RepID=UPI001082353E
MGSNLADLLNEKCSCSTLAKGHFNEEVFSPSGIEGVERFYSETPSFINASDKQRIQEILISIRNALNLTEVRNRILEDYDIKARVQDISGGVFLSLDFHQTKEGPKLIEINTNAGGAYLQLKLLEAQIRCCKAVDLALPNIEALQEIEEKFYSIFIKEWIANNRNGLPGFIAIVDENPQSQFLYPEFLMFRNLFRSKGIHSEILDPKQIKSIEGDLYFEDQKIDLIYNRLTDFHLLQAANFKIKQAWEGGNTVVTPSPLDYDLYARKTNLTFLSDIESIAKVGMSDRDSKVLRKSIPYAKIVTADNAKELWE